MKVLLDANILFSASLPNAHRLALIELLHYQGECIYNTYVFDEAKRNLENKFPNQVRSLDNLVKRMTKVPDCIGLSDISIREKDEPVISSAIKAKATHLLTDDKQDFGVFFGQTIKGVKIVSPTMIANEIIHKFK